MAYHTKTHHREINKTGVKLHVDLHVYRGLAILMEVLSDPRRHPDVEFVNSRGISND